MTAHNNSAEALTKRPTGQPLWDWRFAQGEG